MAKLNQIFQKLSTNYFFAEIEKTVSLYKKENPQARLLNLGIGDVTEPLSEPIVNALIDASKEMGQKPTMRGYGPSNGYSFLREAILQNEYPTMGFSEEEIFISNGSKNDLSSLHEIFCSSNTVALLDPSYPAYLDLQMLSGKAKTDIVFLPCLEKNNFCPELPTIHCDIIYLCSPNNPTGVALNTLELKKWVDYAIEHNAIIVYDGAYEAFITSKNTPHSIYEIDGAKKVALELRSFSKQAGFTNLRCSYYVIPKELMLFLDKTPFCLKDLWTRQIQTKFGGVPYPIQMAAFASYLPEGKKKITKNLESYLRNAKEFKQKLASLGFTVFGGIDSPYIWCKAPTSSLEFFETLLQNLHILCIPGIGFGELGKNFVRFSAFAEKPHLEEAILRMKNL